jgi:metalloendopeptidase OMA1, mitochondrial
MRSSLPACLALWLSVLVGCTTVPETGRRQIIAIPASQEAQLGATTFAQIRQEERVSNDPRYNAQVQRVGQRIAAAVGREVPNAEWEFVVFDSDDVNAFALPGGKVGVYTGLLKLASSDDELATVIGHEIAHVTSRHGAERMTQGLGASAVGMLGSIALGQSEMDPGTRQAVMAAYGVGATLGINYYSREHELEADTIGVRFAAAAGYDPRAAAQFWRKMQAASERSARPPEFMSTHPSDERRIANLEALAREYLPIYEQARRQGGVVGPVPAAAQPVIGGQRPIGSPVIGAE